MSKVVTIVGQGYVGLPLAVEAAKAGWLVHGIEINPKKFQLLRTGISPVEDVKSEELGSLIQEGRYSVHDAFEVVKNSSIVILCVPTPIDKNHLPDLGPLTQACDAVVKFLQPSTLLINESTSFPGTLRKLIKNKVSSLEHSESILLATAPERIDPGSTNWSQSNTTRLIGGIDEESGDRAVEFYSSFCSSVVRVSSPEVAEMAKLLENSFRLVNIAFINELSIFSRKMGIDIREVVDAAATKPYGYMPLYPSAGIGGHCIPVDPYYLMKTMQELGATSPILEIAAKSNVDRPVKVLEEALALKPNCKQLLIVGVSYKPGISDTRESASEKIAEEAIKRGLEVFWWDPFVERCHFGKQWNQEHVDIVILTNALAGKSINLVEINAPVLDCTGTMKGVSQVTII